MQISTEEARSSLQMIDQIVAKTRRHIVRAGGAYYLLLWGTIWFVGNTVSQFWPGRSGLVWMVLDMAGLALSLGIGMWLGRRVRSPWGQRLGLMWLVVWLYGMLIVWASDIRDVNQLNLIISALAMLAYVLSGIWLDNRLAGIGIFVTLMMVIGYLALPAYFSLWMAFFGGGVLIASGIYMLRRWS